MRGGFKQAHRYKGCEMRRPKQMDLPDSKEYRRRSSTAIDCVLAIKVNTKFIRQLRSKVCQVSSYQQSRFGSEVCERSDMQEVT